MTVKDGTGEPELTRLESLFAEYVERLNRGEGLSVERIRAEHPDLAEQLIEELRISRDAWEEARSPAGSGVPSTERDAAGAEGAGEAGHSGC